MEITVEYVEALAEAKRAIRASRTRSVVAVNTGMITLYWHLGNLIANRETEQGWGTKIVERLSNDLRAEFPGMTGLSFRNLRYMRDFALAWSTSEMLPQAVATLPWGHRSRRRHAASSTPQPNDRVAPVLEPQRTNRSVRSRPSNIAHGRSRLPVHRTLTGRTSRTTGRTGTSGRRHPCIQPSGPALKPVQNEGTSAFKSGFGGGGGVVFLGELL
jgi:predicted nuclease of restriction endonuclease-like (RecB) superfamily